MKNFRVVAILAAYNEEDIIAQVVAHLIEEGVLVYFLDNESTDGTVKAVEPFLGKGLLQIERFSGSAAADEMQTADFAWERILRRKEELSRELDADWFIHQDADEFRESPVVGSHVGRCHSGRGSSRLQRDRLRGTQFLADQRSIPDRR